MPSTTSTSRNPQFSCVRFDFLVIGLMADNNCLEKSRSRKPRNSLSSSPLPTRRAMEPLAPAANSRIVPPLPDNSTSMSLLGGSIGSPSLSTGGRNSNCLATTLICTSARSLPVRARSSEPVSVPPWVNDTRLVSMCSASLAATAVNSTAPT